MLSMQECCFLNAIVLSSILLGQAILTKRPTSFQIVTGETKKVDGKQASQHEMLEMVLPL